MFETRISRVVAVDARNGELVRQGGLLVEIAAPGGTEGTLVYEADGQSISINVQGGQDAVYVIWEGKGGQEIVRL